MDTHSSRERHFSGDLNKESGARLQRTKPANPSKLGIFLACPLRYLLETERPAIDRVGDHPTAFLGTAVHHAAEVLRRQGHARSPGCVEVLEKCLGRLLSDSNRSGLLISWMLSRYGKNCLLSRVQFLSQAGFAKSLAERFPAARGAASLRTGTRTTSIPIGQERWLASPVLDVAGRADAIYWAGNGQLRIVDFKTGSIRDSDGSPNRTYVMQVAAYGLIARQLDSKAGISIELLGITDRWISSLDASLVRAVEQLLDNFRNALPLGLMVSSADLAQRGEHCSSCSYRPSCQLYCGFMEHRMAVDHSRSGFDVVGELLDVNNDDEFFTMRLRLANGSIIRISRIPGFLLSMIQRSSGGRVAGFGLRSLEVCRPGAIPQNFSVMDVQHPRNSAFQSYFRLSSLE